MSRLLSLPWIKKEVTSVLSESPRGPNLKPRVVQIFEVHDSIRALIVSDRDHYIGLILTEDCYQNFKKQVGDSTVAKSKYALVQLEHYFFSTLIQAAGNRDMNDVLASKIAWPLVLHCSSIQLLGGDDFGIIGEPREIHRACSISLFPPNYRLLSALLTRKQFRDDSGLPDYDGYWVSYNVTESFPLRQTNCLIPLEQHYRLSQMQAPTHAEVVRIYKNKGSIMTIRSLDSPTADDSREMREDDEGYTFENETEFQQQQQQQQHERDFTYSGDLFSQLEVIEAFDSTQREDMGGTTHIAASAVPDATQQYLTAPMHHSIHSPAIATTAAPSASPYATRVPESDSLSQLITQQPRDGEESVTAQSTSAYTDILTSALRQSANIGEFIRTMFSPINTRKDESSGGAGNTTMETAGDVGSNDRSLSRGEIDDNEAVVDTDGNGHTRDDGGTAVVIFDQTQVENVTTTEHTIGQGLLKTSALRAPSSILSQMIDTMRKEGGLNTHGTEAPRTSQLSRAVGVSRKPSHVESASGGVESGTTRVRGHLRKTAPFSASAADHVQMSASPMLMSESHTQQRFQSQQRESSSLAINMTQKGANHSTYATQPDTLFQEFDQTEAPSLLAIEEAQNIMGQESGVRTTEKAGASSATRRVSSSLSSSLPAFSRGAAHHTSCTLGQSQVQQLSIDSRTSKALGAAAIGADIAQAGTMDLARLNRRSRASMLAAKRQAILEGLRMTDLFVAEIPPKSAGESGSNKRIRASSSSSSSSTISRKISPSASSGGRARSGKVYVNPGAMIAPHRNVGGPSADRVSSIATISSESSVSDRAAGSAQLQHRPPIVKKLIQVVFPGYPPMGYPKKRPRAQ